MRVPGPFNQKIDNRYYADRHRIIKEMIHAIRELDHDVTWDQMKHIIHDFKVDARKTRKEFAARRDRRSFDLWLDTAFATVFALSTPVAPITGIGFGSLFALFAACDLKKLHGMADDVERCLQSKSRQTVSHHMLDKIERSVNELYVQWNPPAEITAAGFFSNRHAHSGQQHHHRQSMARRRV